MKKFVTSAALCATTLLAVNTASAATATEREILKKLEFLQNKIAAQQERITYLEDKVGKNDKNASSDSSVITLANKAIDQLKIKSDLRVRYERRDHDEPQGEDEGRDRWRTRFRLGGVWKNKAEKWEVGAGLATGGSSATSTNATWSENEFFETSDIRLDYAYAKHKWKDFSITLGQQKDPFAKSWIYLDSDVRPAGLTLHYGQKQGVFITAGSYALRYYKAGNDANTAMLWHGQTGWKGKAGKVSYTVAGGYQVYDGVFSNHEAPNPDYDYEIADLYATASVLAGIAKLSFYGHIWTNLGADGNDGQGVLGSTLNPEDEDMGWILGMKAKMGPVKLSYAYAVVEADSLYGDLKDQDFGDGLSDTDVKGHKLGASYSFTKNFSTGVTAQFYEANERSDEEDVDLYQLDFKYKF
ncbi:MAG: putative porin [Thermodesulfobacteriota bacterium]